MAILLVLEFIQELLKCLVAGVRGGWGRRRRNGRGLFREWRGRGDDGLLRLFRRAVNHLMLPPNEPPQRTLQTGTKTQTHITQQHSPLPEQGV